jgi:glycerophosphoryl diester phosphodiesterase
MSNDAVGTPSPSSVQVGRPAGTGCGQQEPVTDDSRRLRRWGRGLVWGSLAILGLLGTAYLALGFHIVVSCGLPAAPQAGGWASPDLLAPARYPATSWPLLIGHSGSTYWCQRNTLGCLYRSIELGATMLEVDIRLSGDGYLVAFHDADVDHQTDGTGAVQSLTHEQLRTLTVGPDFTPPEAETDAPAALQRQRVALLEEVRQAFPDIPLLIDVKSHTPPMDDALVAFVRRFHALSPPGVLDLPLWLASPSLVKRATAAGHLVVVSMVNEPQDFQKALALPGLFGIVTDRPEMAFQMRPPKPHTLGESLTKEPS